MVNKCFVIKVILTEERESVAGGPKLLLYERDWFKHSVFPPSLSLFLLSHRFSAILNPLFLTLFLSSFYSANSAVVTLACQWRSHSFLLFGPHVDATEHPSKPQKSVPCAPDPPLVFQSLLDKPSQQQL